MGIEAGIKEKAPKRFDQKIKKKIRNILIGLSLLFGVPAFSADTGPTKTTPIDSRYPGFTQQTYIDNVKNDGSIVSFDSAKLKIDSASTSLLNLLNNWSTESASHAEDSSQLDAIVRDLNMTILNMQAAAVGLHDQSDSLFNLLHEMNPDSRLLYDFNTLISTAVATKDAQIVRSFLAGQSGAEDPIILALSAIADVKVQTADEVGRQPAGTQLLDAVFSLREKIRNGGSPTEEDKTLVGQLAEAASSETVRLENMHDSLQQQVDLIAGDYLSMLDANDRANSLHTLAMLLSVLTLVGAAVFHVSGKKPDNSDNFPEEETAHDAFLTLTPEILTFEKAAELVKARVGDLVQRTQILDLMQQNWATISDDLKKINFRILSGNQILGNDGEIETLSPSALDDLNYAAIANRLSDTGSAGSDQDSDPNENPLRVLKS